MSAAVAPLCSQKCCGYCSADDATDPLPVIILVVLFDGPPTKESLPDPTYSFDGNTVKALEAARGIIATQGKNKGYLRASKPKLDERIVTRERYGYESEYRDPSLASSATAQIWRSVAFSISPIAEHACLPVMADFDSPFDMTHAESREFARWCQDVADIILLQYSLGERPNDMRWSQALGSVDHEFERLGWFTSVGLRCIMNPSEARRTHHVQTHTRPIDQTDRSVHLGSYHSICCASTCGFTPMATVVRPVICGGFCWPRPRATPPSRRSVPI